jgi:hypothetical protein
MPMSLLAKLHSFSCNKPIRRTYMAQLYVKYVSCNFMQYLTRPIQQCEGLQLHRIIQLRFRVR